MIQDMTDVIIVASLIIAACSLAVNIAAGLGERKRPFSLLRLTGVPIGVLAPDRRTRECAAPSHRRGRVGRGRPGVGGPLPPLSSRHCISNPRDRLLGNRPRWTRCVTGDHRLHVPTPQPDDRTRSRPKRLIARRPHGAQKGRIWADDNRDQCHRGAARGTPQMFFWPIHLRFGQGVFPRSRQAAHSSSYSASPRRSRVAMRTTWESSRRVGVWAARKRVTPTRISADCSEPSGQARHCRTAAS